MSIITLIIMYPCYLLFYVCLFVSVYVYNVLSLYWERPVVSLQYPGGEVVGSC